MTTNDKIAGERAALPAFPPLSYFLENSTHDMQREAIRGYAREYARLALTSKEPAGAVIAPPIECTTCGALVVGVAPLTNAPAEPDTRYGTEQYMRGFNDAKAQFAPAETPPAVAPAAEVVAYQMHEEDSTRIHATLYAPVLKEFCLEATRDDEGRNWYIEVTDESGYHTYDGYWRDSKSKSCAEVLAEAAEGSMLHEINLPPEGTCALAAPAIDAREQEGGQPSDALIGALVSAHGHATMPYIISRIRRAFADAALASREEAPAAAPSEAQNPKFTMQEWEAHARKHRWRFDLDTPVDGTATEEAPKHEGMTIAGNGASMLGALMREQRASRIGVYPDGNPNTRQPEAPAAAGAAQAVEKWIFDPHDIEQGMMLNPAWLKLHGPTAAQAASASPATVARPVAYVNGDDLDNMLDDRTAVIQRTRSGFRNTPLYAAAQPCTPQGCALHTKLIAAANYIDALGGDSKSYRAALSTAKSVEHGATDGGTGE